MYLRMRRRLGDERAATLVLLSLIMVALLASAGLVVNIGMVRADRQRNKSVADVAVTAGMQSFDAGSGQIATFWGACAALDYLKTNHPELASLALNTGWTDGSGAAISGNPCDSTPSAAYTAHYNTICDSSSSATARDSFAWFTGSTSQIQVEVRAGYAASDMASGGFRDDDFHSDTGAADQHGCDQLAVIITEKEDAGFGRVVGASELSSRIRSVGRVTIEESSEAAVALLLIEPSECQALKVGGAGSGVRVRGTASRPGIIHADSTGADCSGSNRVLTGHHANGIVAEAAPDPPNGAGIVSVSASMPSPAYDSTTNVVAQGGSPQNGAPKGRGPVDQRYLGLGSPSYGMTKLRSDASTAFGWTPATVPADYAVVTNCNSLPAVYDPAPLTKVFLDCDLSKSVDFASTITDIVVTGNIDLGGGGGVTVTMPNVRNLFVYGETGNNGKGIYLGSNGTLSVNRRGQASCAAREAIDRTETTKLVVGNGQLGAGSSSSMLRMCSTTVFLMAGSLPTSIGTTPGDNSYNGKLDITAGASLEWTAPNRSPNSLPTDDDLKNLEDLALWTETSDGNKIGGSNASMTLKGIFFTPNADYFDINAGGAGITADAQFITRKLNVQGGGTLSMTADPNNSVPIKFLSGFSLVR